MLTALWLERQAAGRKGGIASGQSKKRLAGVTDSSKAEAEVSTPKQTEGSSSNSCSFSYSRKERLTVREADLEPIYQLYPKRPNQRKNIGIRTLLGQIKTAKDFFQLKLAVENYRKYVSLHVDDPKHIKRFATFALEWREWIDPPFAGPKTHSH